MPAMLELCRMSREMRPEHLPGQSGLRDELPAPPWMAVHLSSRPCSFPEEEHSPYLASYLLVPVPGEHRNPERPLARDTATHLCWSKHMEGKVFSMNAVPLNTHHTGLQEHL